VAPALDPAPATWRSPTIRAMANPTDFLGAMAKVDEVNRKVGRAVGFGAAGAGRADFGFAATAQKVLADTRPAWVVAQDRSAAALFPKPMPRFHSPLATSMIDSLRGPDLGAAFFAGGRPGAGTKAAQIDFTGDIAVASRGLGVIAGGSAKLGGAGKALGFLGSGDPTAAQAAARIGGVLAAAGLGETARPDLLGSKAAAGGAPWASARVQSPDRESAYKAINFGIFPEGTGKSLGALGLGVGSVSALKGLRATGALADPAGRGFDAHRVFGALGVAGSLAPSLTDAHSRAIALGASPGAAGIFADLRRGGAVPDLLAGLGIGEARSPRTAIAATELLAATFSLKPIAGAAAVGARPGPFPGRWSPAAGAFAEATRAATLYGAILGAEAVDLVEDRTQEAELAAGSLAAQAAEPLVELGRRFAGLSPATRAMIAFALVEAAFAMLREAEAARLLHLPLLVDPSVDLLMRILAVLLACKGD
jgi:hypothetical protein